MADITPESILKKLKTIPKELYTKNTIPLFGGLPPFPWTQLSGELEHIFHLNDLSLSASGWQWRTKDELLVGMEDAIPFTFSITPLEGMLTLAFSQRDLEDLYHALLFDGSEEKAVIDRAFAEAFRQFLFIEVAAAVRNCNFDASLAPQLHVKSQLPQEEAMSGHLSFTLHKKERYGRIFISEKLLHSMKQRFAENERNQRYASSVAEQLQVTLQVEAGQMEITQSEWDKVCPGDFIVLDNCSLKPGEASSKVLLTVNNIPLFVANKEGKKIKILEHP